MKLQDRRVEEDGREGRRAEERIWLDSCPGLRGSEAEIQLESTDEEIPKSSALNFQRSLKQKSKKSEFRSLHMLIQILNILCVKNQGLTIFNRLHLRRTFLVIFVDPCLGDRSCRLMLKCYETTFACELHPIWN